MTTRLQFLTGVRAELQDVGPTNYLWSYAVLQGYLNDALNQLGIDLPPVKEIIIAAWHGVKASKTGRNDIYYYECASKHKLKKPCSLGRIRAEVIEAEILKAIVEAFEPVKIYELASKLEAFEREQRRWKRPADCYN